MRNILQFSINILKYKNSRKKEKMYINELESGQNKIIQPDDDSFNTVRLLIKKRRKRRF